MTIIYHNPRCSKSREALKILNDNNINPDIILYLEKGLEEDEVRKILKLLKTNPIDIMRKKEKEFKEHGLDKHFSSDDDLINAIIKSPKLLERPIVIHDNKAVIARPPEEIMKII